MLLGSEIPNLLSIDRYSPHIGADTDWGACMHKTFKRCGLNGILNIPFDNIIIDIPFKQILDMSVKNILNIKIAV